MTTVGAAYCVVFTARLRAHDPEYASTADQLRTLASEQPGFCGIESSGGHTVGELEITVSYWDSLDAIAAWKAHPEHARAQSMGRERWYSSYSVRVARVEREYRSPASLGRRDAHTDVTRHP